MLNGNKLKIGYLAPELPALSATFVYNEILELKKQGCDIQCYSVHKPKTDVEANIKSKLGKIEELYESSFSSRVFALLVCCFKYPKCTISALKWLLSDLYDLGFSKRTFGQCYRFITAAKLSLSLRQSNVSHLHVHFAHVPTDIAMYASKMAGISYSVCAHANDIFERGYLIKQKIERSKFFATISDYNKQYLKNLTINDNLKVVRCGVALNAFTPRLIQPNNQITKIGVLGRLVEKKGIHVLLEAIACLKNNNIIVEIVGDGPEKNRLEHIVANNHLQNKVKFLGQMPNTEVASWLQGIDFFALPCVQDANGDKDGIPVSLMEAMLKGVPVISSRLSGIPELVMHNQTGFLSESGCVNSLVNTLKEALAMSLEQRELIASNAVDHIKQNFAIETNVSYLRALINE
ncbi:glycosyltransferase [Pseudoalteromonas sp.]|uniref:glycosyltransferase n=1 Tax=Pseudoalteromonas sp. TaxID=53249 RepID=UPI0035671A11